MKDKVPAKTQSVSDFLSDVRRIAASLKAPTFNKVVANLLKVTVVVSICGAIFALIDFAVAPVAKFLLNS